MFISEKGKNKRAPFCTFYRIQRAIYVASIRTHETKTVIIFLKTNILRNQIAKL